MPLGSDFSRQFDSTFAAEAVSPTYRVAAVLAEVPCRGGFPGSGRKRPPDVAAARPFEPVEGRGSILRRSREFSKQECGDLVAAGDSEA